MSPRQQSGRVLYFGCWDHHAGHHLRDVDGVMLPYETQTPWTGSLDGGLCLRPDGRYSEAPNGVAALHHKDGWTALAFWDNSVDTRRGSHSTFLMEGTYDFDAALARAREHFDAIFARYDFEVVPYEGRKAA